MRGRMPKLRRKEAEELEKQKQVEAQPFETQNLEFDYVSWGYSDQFNHDMWDNSQLEVDLANQSSITQKPRQQSTSVECV
ncbi:hypothetical protein H5410_042782 [Solanum commersonii]|uniref:Uncharacterized protein n=1 Tax=Solanum commersonii TaxID=4109 RepID=A0A9J5XYN1_SOLCO|nr:hypothetical protein H5410_042782 [Solanum commersonii]